MPNYVINEVIFPNVNQEQQAAILAKVNGKWGPIDFETLLPVPINYWKGDTTLIHDQVFPGVALDWCTKNWSTKWNAVALFVLPGEAERYQQIVQTETSLTLTFLTAWSPACGWIVALFNTFHLEIVHNWLNEEDSVGYTDHYYLEGAHGEEWHRVPANQEMQRHLMFLRYGVESF